MKALLVVAMALVLLPLVPFAQAQEHVDDCDGDPTTDDPGTAYPDAGNQILCIPDSAGGVPDPCTDNDESTPCPDDVVGGIGDPTGDIEPEPPVITIASTPATAPENGGPITVTFTRTNSETDAAPVAVVVAFTLSSNASQPNVDYAVDGARSFDGVASGTVEIAGDAASAAILLRPLRDDEHPEADELIVATIQPGDGYTVGSPSQTSATLTSVPFNTVTLQVVDGIGLENSTDSMSFIVVRTGPVTEALTVFLDIPDDASTFESTPADATRITIATGQTASAAVRINGTDDDQRGGKQFVFTIVEALAGRDGYAIGNESSVTLVLLDDDTPFVTVAAQAADFTEATPGGVTVTRSAKNSASALSVSVEVSGTAQQGADYTISGVSNDVITFEPNQLSRTLTLTPVQDSAKEGTQTVQVTLRPGDGYNIIEATSTATVNLLDDDVPTVSLAARTASSREGVATPAVVAVQRNANGLANPLTVSFSIEGASASDYTVSADGTWSFQAGQGTLTFPADVASVDLRILAVDDSTSESNETLTVRLRQPTSDIDYGVGTAATAQVVLVDNDLVDADQDGIDDAIDNCLGAANADQLDSDADGDGNVCDNDDDNDGLSDAREAELGSNPLATDSDGDGRGDGAEDQAGTDPTDRFSPEYRAGNVTAELVDSGVQVSWVLPTGSLVDRFLVFRASTPTLVREVNATDGQTAFLIVDGQFPGGTHTYYVQAMLAQDEGQAFDEQAAVASAPLTASLCEAYPTDSDGDGLCNREEAQRGTDPDQADSDGDGLSDQAELEAGSNPLDASSPAAAKSSTLPREAPFWAGLALAVAALALVTVAVVRLGRSRSA